jgi:hypothetical protein
MTCTTDDNGPRTVKGKIRYQNIDLAEFTAQLTVDNVAPTASFSAPTTGTEGRPIALALQSGADPSSADTAAGFSYAFDCGAGYGSFSTSKTAACQAADNGPLTVKGKIKDKDNGTTEYTAIVAITNAAPTATFQVPTKAITGYKFELALANAADASGDLASLQYAFDCGDGAGYGAFGPDATTGCTSASAGVRTVRSIVKDKDGAETEYSAKVTITDAVAVSITAPRAGDQLAVDTPVELTATFTDQIRNTTHTCEIDWGDDTPAEVGEIQEGIGKGTCVSKHAYAVPGEYTIKVTVTNAAGDSSIADVTIVVEPKGK